LVLPLLFSCAESPIMPPMPETPDDLKSKHQRLATWIFGSVLLVFFLGVFLFAPSELPEFKQRMLAVSSALLAGLFGFFFTGAVQVRVKPVENVFGKVAVKATGGSALFVLVLAWWLSPLAPVKTGGQVKEVQFWPEYNQVTVFSKKPVEAILYSFDKSAWKPAEALQSHSTALDVECTQARLNERDLVSNKATGKVFVKYRMVGGQESKVHEFAFDPQKVLSGRIAPVQPDLDFGAIRKDAEDQMQKTREKIKAMEKKYEQRP
jgi:hypothetical protein